MFVSSTRKENSETNSTYLCWLEVGRSAGRTKGSGCAEVASHEGENGRSRKERKKKRSENIGGGGKKTSWGIKRKINISYWAIGGIGFDVSLLALKLL